MPPHHIERQRVDMFAHEILSFLCLSAISLPILPRGLEDARQPCGRTYIVTADSWSFERFDSHMTSRSSLRCCCFDAGFESFIASLDAAEVESVPFAPQYQYLQLTQQPGMSSVCFWGSSQQRYDRQRLFVRDCFADLAHLISDKRCAYIDSVIEATSSRDDTRNPAGVIISGTSGVGISTVAV